jgi:hypothetical protein
MPALSTSPAAWAATTVYPLWSQVTSGGSAYLCVVSHLSGSAFDPVDWLLIGAGPFFGVGGRGTPDTTAVSMTVGSYTMVTGTKIALVTSELAVGARFKFTVGMDKTAAGVATFGVRLAYGTVGTAAGDSAVATWTSGTNTAAIDQAILEIIAQCTAIGSGTSATWACLAIYVNTQTNATGLGKISPAPGSTAGFNSTATSPFLHIDINAGTAAVMTAWGNAERIA